MINLTSKAIILIGEDRTQERFDPSGVIAKVSVRYEPSGFVPGTNYPCYVRLGIVEGLPDGDEPCFVERSVFLAMNPRRANVFTHGDGCVRYAGANDVIVTKLEGF